MNCKYHIIYTYIHKRLTKIIFYNLKQIKIFRWVLAHSNFINYSCIHLFSVGALTDGYSDDFSVRKQDFEVHWGYITLYKSRTEKMRSWDSSVGTVTELQADNPNTHKHTHMHTHTDTRACTRARTHTHTHTHTHTQSNMSTIKLGIFLP